MTCLLPLSPIYTVTFFLTAKDSKQKVILDDSPPFYQLQDEEHALAFRARRSVCAIITEGLGSTGLAEHEGPLSKIGAPILKALVGNNLIEVMPVRILSKRRSRTEQENHENLQGMPSMAQLKKALMSVAYFYELRRTPPSTYLNFIPEKDRVEPISKKAAYNISHFMINVGECILEGSVGSRDDTKKANKSSKAVGRQLNGEKGEGREDKGKGMKLYKPKYRPTEDHNSKAKLVIDKGRKDSCHVDSDEESSSSLIELDSREGFLVSRSPEEGMISGLKSVSHLKRSNPLVGHDHFQLEELLDTSVKSDSSGEVVHR
ncbi:hypothetical protein QYF36_001849 [Acer negundo]|nr:hypothetical protein QYF36_001849 [Acer negundo]